MSVVLNVVWIVFGGGIPISILYFVAGLLFCVTIVGIPCGLQLFKLAFLALFPFGNSIERYEEERFDGLGGGQGNCGGAGAAARVEGGAAAVRGSLSCRPGVVTAPHARAPRRPRLPNG